MKKVPSALSEARFVSGFTQVQMAEKMGVAVSTVFNWEKNPDGMRNGNFWKWYRMMNSRGKAILDQYLDDKRNFFIA